MTALAILGGITLTLIVIGVLLWSVGVIRFVHRRVPPEKLAMDEINASLDRIFSDLAEHQRKQERARD